MPSWNWDELTGAVVDNRYRLRSLAERGRDQAEFLAEPVSGTDPQTVTITLVAPDESVRESLLSEMQAASRLEHPNLLQMLSAGQWSTDRGALLYLAAERPDHTLADRLRRGALPEREARELLEDICAGLEYLHACGLIYGTLAAHTTVRAGGRWKLADFGGLRRSDDASEDVFAIGILMREAVAGSASHAFDAIVRGCLDPEPARRPGLQGIRAIAAAPPAPPAARGASERAAPRQAAFAQRKSTRSLRAAAWVGVPALAAAIVMAVWLTRDSSADSPPRKEPAVAKQTPPPPVRNGADRPSPFVDKKPQQPKPAPAAAAKAPAAPHTANGSGETGKADYSSSDMDGRSTASGELFSSRELTAAHRSYPIGTRLRITNLGNGRSVVVRVNDRLFSPGRVVRVTRRAADELGFTNQGTADVRIEPVK